MEEQEKKKAEFFDRALAIWRNDNLFDDGVMAELEKLFDQYDVDTDLDETPREEAGRKLDL